MGWRAAIASGRASGSAAAPTGALAVDVEWQVKKLLDLWRSVVLTVTRFIPCLAFPAGLVRLVIR